MTVGEIQNRYIHKPTSEMVEFAECLRNSLSDRESWLCWIGDITGATKRRELLTESGPWRVFEGVHYGRMGSFLPDNENKIDKILNDIDLGIDDIIKKNRNFFQKYPVTYAERKDSYKEKGIYNGKFLVAGESIEKLKTTDTHTITLYDIWTDGEVINVKPSDTHTGIINLSVRNYSVVLIRTYLSSDDPQMSTQFSVKMFV